jgi:hypothetical protein
MFHGGNLRRSGAFTNVHAYYKVSAVDFYKSCRGKAV